jgi:hypothetical protein
MTETKAVVKSSDIVLVQVLQTPVIVLHADVVGKAQGIMVRSDGILKVDDVFTLAEADEIQKSTKDLLKDIEAERVRVKAPFLAVCKQIDEASGEVMDKLKVCGKTLGNKILTFSQEQERIRQAAETAARIEREKAEALARAEAEKINAENRRKAEEAKAANRPPPAPVTVTLPKPVVQAYVPPAIKSTSTTTMKRKVLVIDDKTQIPWSIQEVELLTVNETAIIKLLLAGIKVPGCRIEEREVPRGL